MPVPTTFAESWRSIFGWAIMGAGLFCGGMAVAMILIFVWGGWPESRYEQILTILGIGFGGFLAGMMIVMVAMAVGGPVGRFKAGVSKGGLNFEASGDGEPPPQIIAAAAAGGAAGAVAGAAAASPEGEGE